MEHQGRRPWGWADADLMRLPSGAWCIHVLIKHGCLSGGAPLVNVGWIETILLIVNRVNLKRRWRRQFVQGFPLLRHVMKDGHWREHLLIQKTMGGGKT